MEMQLEHLMKVLSKDDHELVKIFIDFLEKGGALQTLYGNLVHLLMRTPYPSLQILWLLHDKSKFYIGKIMTEALQNLIAQNVTEFSLQFINFLANFPLNILDASSMRQKFWTALKIHLLNDKIYIALLSRRESRLLDDVLNHIYQQCQTCAVFPSKEFVLYQSFNNKMHFVTLASTQIKDFRAIDNICIRNNLLVLKIAHEFSNTSQTLAEIGNVRKWLECFAVEQTADDLQEVHKFFFADFQRICVMMEFLKTHCDIFKTIKVQNLLSTSSILELVYEYDINASFEDLRRIVAATYQWQQKIPALKCLHELELETINYYAALSTVYDVIMAVSQLNQEHYFSVRMQQLNSMLRQMPNIDILCSLIEDILQLVFLRWENLRSDGAGSTEISTQRSRSARSSSSNSSDSVAAETPTPAFLAPSVVVNVRHGFICSGRALHQLFTFLKNFLTKKLHSEDLKQASERLQLRFQRIFDIISEGLWKYSVLEKIDDSLIRAGTHQKYQLEPEELLQLVQMHVTTMEKSSSEDESRERLNYSSLTRRKATKKRRRATFSGGAGATTSNSALALEKSRARANVMVASVSAVQGTTDPVTELKAHKMVARFTDRSIIPKMLGSPENLAIMALALKNFNDVKYIIETFKLRNTDLNRELQFVEQQQQVKQKLAAIYTSYQRQEQSTGSSTNREPKATVEQIKSVAAKGFEVSKIINIIDNFAQAQKIQQSDEFKQLLLKYNNNPQYEFLHQFEECNLNAVIISDLILNLPFNREVTSNILMVIRRQQQIMVTRLQEDAAALTNTSNIGKELGAASLQENLCECLRLMPGKSLRDLLFDNFYSLKPRKLAVELQREQAFHAVFYKASADIGSCDNLKAYLPLFQNLQSKSNYYVRFYTYITYLAKLLQLRDPNIEYHTDELLKIDPADVIGELVFECNMTPLEVEANVSALNLNLVHVIASNICPEIAGKCKISKTPKQKRETILNYISNQNHLLAYVLRGIDNADDFAKDNAANAVFLQRMLRLSEIEKLSQLYDNNRFIAALRSDNLNMRLVELLELKEQLNMLVLQIGYREPKHVQKKLIDKIIVCLMKEDSRNINLATHIQDIALKAKLIHENFTKISTTRLAKELIESTLQHKEASTRISSDLQGKLVDTLTDITIYAKVSEVLQFETWPQAYDFGLKTPHTIFEKLLQLHLYKLCYKWCKVVKLSERFAQQKKTFLTALLKALLELNDNRTQRNVEVNKYLLQILETFSVEDCFSFFDANKDKFRSVQLLKYVIDYLMEQTRDTSIYRNYKISLVIFEQLTPCEREQFWSILRYPLLILEQLIMNAKFEILTKVLQAVRKALPENTKIIDVPATMSATQSLTVCPYCFDKRGHIYDVHAKANSSSPQSKVSFKLGSDATNTTNSAFILLSFNLYQKDHIITNECIDLLLRIYATKSLDYHISDTHSSSEQISQTTDLQQSLDSLCGAFLIPKFAPTRDEWVRDEEATHCMCCHRAAFTMLMRRHHCRRCGRVICFACSTHRMRISELYDEVEVRICADCHHHNEETQRKTQQSESRVVLPAAGIHCRDTHMFKWKLSGNITHDKVLREEFCYEHAPSVALCLSILEYHLGHQKCVDLLLYHCRKLEKLIVPNPEVDYELVAKMMNCLALAAKVRGGPAEIETIREHSEIIMSVVQNGCEVLIPPGPLDNHSLRKLGDSLVQAEKWQLALEVQLKCGFPTAGVMAAHGLSCLRAGCFDTAREKLSHCMPKLSNELFNSKIYKYVMQTRSGDENLNALLTREQTDISNIRRPQRGPALLQEIIKIIESIPFNKIQPETLQRASIIRNSNTSLASLLSRRKDHYTVPMHEPALNILTTLANLKRITHGQYSEGNLTKSSDAKSSEQTRNFEECMHYVLTYGSHADILQYLMQQQELMPALKYYLLQNLDAELFIHNIFLPSLSSGLVPKLIEHMLDLDGQLLIWRHTLLQTCRYLETKNFLNSLYQLQILLKDPVRASITCVKFYTMNCETFQQLQANAPHLHNAHRHLQSELEIAQWENINLESLQPQKRRISLTTQRRASTISNNSTSASASFLMQMDARSLNSHINTILKQLDVAKFLAKCEKENSTASDTLITEQILKQMRIESAKSALPTLFDAVQDKIQVCILILYCGKNIEEGFGLVYRIIQDYKLPALKIYGATAKYLARNQRLMEVEKLLNCITSNNGISTAEIDEILSIAINSATNSHEPEVKTALDNLVKKINSIELRISCHIFIGQLKSAYLLANKYERLNDIRKILRQAELANQIHIKRLCEKKLNMSTSQTE